MKKPAKYFIAFSFITLTIIVILLFNNQHKIDRNLLNDYSSDIYTQVTPEDLGMTKAEMFHTLRISNEKSSEYDFKFYMLDYGGLSELHAKGISSVDGNCYNIAMVNADRYISRTKEASFFMFIQSDLPQVYHQCEGDPCESCTFERDNDGEINGCDCNTYGQCNHTIISG